VAVAGFDDHPTLAPAMEPPLTSMHQDPREQVHAMVKTLMQLVGNEAPKPRQQILRVSLTVRASSS
jgi:DNA-binding LacI/PurR family transcriptional regulator